MHGRRRAGATARRPRDRRGTGFRFVTEHVAEFAKRGICARDPQRVAARRRRDGDAAPSSVSDDFEPYSPANALPYGHRWRLFHTAERRVPHRQHAPEGISLFDILQPAYAALYSGAFHPTAEGHAIVADHVMRHVRSAARQGEEAAGRGTVELT